MKFLMLWAVTVSLVSVLVGGFLSFHLEFDSSLPNSAIQQVEFHAADLHTHDSDFDPCSEGYCHLGHCAVVLIPRVAGLADQSLYMVSYHSEEFSLIGRFLEGPFQPPRPV